MRSKFVILLFAVVSVFIVFNKDREHDNQFSNDKCGYYLYLPAIFIYHDLKGFSFCDSLNKKYNNSLNEQYSLHNVNGNKLDKYPAGVSLFELPLFLIADLYCSVNQNYAADGFSLPYQLGGIFSNICWVIAGLFVLRKFLKKYFNDSVVAITLGCIAFGTNLYAYTTFDIGMGHPYSFFLFSSTLCLTDKWYSSARTTSIYLNILIGIVLGLVFIVRPINIIIVIIPLLWHVDSMALLKERVALLLSQYKKVLTIALSFLLVAFIQFAYWKYITGHWLYYSYQGEGFDFLHPHIFKGLFSYRKGWFVYTPMAVLGFIGFYALWKKNKALIPALSVFFVLMIYCVFSWREWWYGGSFGCRPLVEALAVIALPLAAVIEWMYNLSSKIKKAICFTLVLLIIILNIFQTYQYSMGLIHWDRMTSTYYWKVFGRIDFDRVKNEQYLLKEDVANHVD